MSAKVVVLGAGEPSKQLSFRVRKGAAGGRILAGVVRVCRKAGLASLEAGEPALEEVRLPGGADAVAEEGLRSDDIIRYGGGPLINLPPPPLLSFVTRARRSSSIFPRALPT